jgi:hypothetical protein
MRKDYRPNNPFGERPDKPLVPTWLFDPTTTTTTTTESTRGGYRNGERSERRRSERSPAVKRPVQSAAGRIHTSPPGGDTWLDDNSHFRPPGGNPPKTKKQRQKGRLFHRLKSGMTWHKNDFGRFMTLTSSDDSRELEKHFKQLVQRIRRLTPARLIKKGYLERKHLRKYYPGLKMNTPLKFDYIRIKTAEGNGVLHIIFYGNYIPRSWIKDTWETLHNAWSVNIKAIRNNKAAAGYVLRQYVAGQDALINYSWSPGWVHRRYVARWKDLLRTLTFDQALREWHYLMENQITPPKTTQQTELTTWQKMQKLKDPMK